MLLQQPRVRASKHLTTTAILFFLRAFAKGLRAAIDYPTIVTILITGTFTLVLLEVMVKLPDSQNSFLFLPKAVWVSVLASMLAAFLYGVIGQAVRVVRGAREGVYVDYYTDMVDHKGLFHIYLQRGSEEALSKYCQCVQKSNVRIWAFGMTLNNVINQQHAIMVERALKTQADVVFGFWDPHASLTVRSGFASISLIDAQKGLEGETDGGAWNQRFEERLERIRSAVACAKKPFSGRVRVFCFALPANFSCFIVDDDVFFFPFLSNAESTRQPIFHCSAVDGIGEELVSHARRLIDGTDSSIERLRGCMFDTKEKRK